MRNVYVVTHPEATHHVDHLVGGWYDSQLTEAGVVAAESIGAALRARIPLGGEIELYSSDLQRASQTAQIVGDLLDADMTIDQRLREKSYGEAEGKPQAWLDQRFIPPPAAGDRLHQTRAFRARRPDGYSRGGCTRRWSASSNPTARIKSS